eukprot:gene4492-8934_t
MILGLGLLAIIIGQSYARLTGDFLASITKNVAYQESLPYGSITTTSGYFVVKFFGFSEDCTGFNDELHWVPLGICISFGEGYGKFSAATAPNNDLYFIYDIFANTDNTCSSSIKNGIVYKKRTSGTCEISNFSFQHRNGSEIASIQPSITYPSGGSLQRHYQSVEECQLQTGAYMGFFESSTSCNSIASAASTIGVQYLTRTCTSKQIIENTYTYSDQCLASQTSSSQSVTIGACTAATDTYGNTIYVSAECINDGDSNSHSSPGSTTNTSSQGSESGGSKSASCFAGSETVQTETEGVKLISEVVVGDRVLAYSVATGSFGYSDVIAVPHDVNDITMSFRDIHTSSGKNVKMTDLHLLPAGNCDNKNSLQAQEQSPTTTTVTSAVTSSFPLVEASRVRTGQCIMTTTGIEKVLSNTPVNAKGIYTIVTNSDYIVVSDIVASPFAISHYMGTAYYTMHRTLFALMPEMLKSSYWLRWNTFIAHAVLYATSAAAV